MAIENYGPSRPKVLETYENFPTATYIQGVADKIAHDIELVAELYNGKQFVLFRASESDRCTICTDAITGAVLLSNCPVCMGTGKVDGYTKIGSYWALCEFGAELSTISEFGNLEVRMEPDTMIAIKAPMVFESDIVVFPYYKKVFKIVDHEGQLAAVQGTVLLQQLNIIKITEGSIEYSLLDKI